MTSSLSLMFFSTLWLGVLIGVSFVATPAKFNAESLSLIEALDVGQHTFSTFRWIEGSFCAALLAHLLWLKDIRFFAPIVLVLVSLVAVQVFVLLPTLGVRIDAYLSGTPPPPSSDHFTYALIEIAKVVVLVALIVATAINVSKD